MSKQQKCTMQVDENPRFCYAFESAEDRGSYKCTELPYNVKEEFGKGRIKVYATFDGIPSCTDTGAGAHHGVCASIRAELGKQPGDVVHVTIRERG